MDYADDELNVEDAEGSMSSSSSLLKPFNETVSVDSKTKASRRHFQMAVKKMLSHKVRHCVEFVSRNLAG